jgi:hypothetical protein
MCVRGALMLLWKCWVLGADGGASRQVASSKARVRISPAGYRLLRRCSSPAVLPARMEFWRTALLPARVEFGEDALSLSFFVREVFFLFFFSSWVVQLDTCQTLDPEVRLFLASGGFSALSNRKVPGWSIFSHQPV